MTNFGLGWLILYQAWLKGKKYFLKFERNLSKFLSRFLLRKVWKISLYKGGNFPKKLSKKIQEIFRFFQIFYLSFFESLLKEFKENNFLGLISLNQVSLVKVFY